MSGRRIVFIVGPPRSGTTLLQSIIASHSAVDTLPETHLFEDVLPALGGANLSPDSSFPTDALPLVNKALGKSGFALDLSAARLALQDASVKGVFEYLVETFVRRDAAVCLEKTPGHARHIVEIRRFFPDAKFVAVVRHPVESVGSMSNQRPVSIYDTRLQYIMPLTKLARHWAAHCTGLLANQGEHLTILRYEDLVAEPEKVIRAVCQFLDLDFEPGMLSGFADTARTFINLTYEPWKSENLSGAVADNRYKWRSRLPAGQVWLVEETAAPYLLRFGYERMPCPPRWRRRMALWRETLLQFAVRWRLEERLRHRLILVMTGCQRHAAGLGIARGTRIAGSCQQDSSCRGPHFP